MLRASDIGDHSPHNAGNENDPTIHQSRWLNDSFPGLLLPDQIWGEAIKALRLWEEWSPTGLVWDPVFCRLLHNGVWDSRESGHPAAEVMAMTLGTRAQIPTGYMVKTLRSQSTCGSNMPSDQMLSTF